MSTIDAHPERSRSLHPYLQQHGIKAVLCDHDDTLVATFEAKSRQHMIIAERYYGKILTQAFIAEHWGKPLQELVQILYETSDVERALALSKSLQHLFPKIGNPSVMEIMRTLRKENIRTGVVTATMRFSFENDCRILGWEHALFDYVQTAEDSQLHKPNPRVFDPALLWLHKLNIQPREVLYIGDGLHDLHAARGAGLHFIGVCSGINTPTVFSSHQALSLPTIASLLV